MAKALNDGMMEFEDKTPATVSQMAKDVTVFLVGSPLLLLLGVAAACGSDRAWNIQSGLGCGAQAR